MRKILGFAAGVACAALGLGTGCAPGVTRTAAGTVAQGEPGGANGRAAVERFLTAARGGDTRSMGLTFGTAQGPVAGRDAAADVEKRMLALACYVGHDRAQVLEDVPGTGSERLVTVELAQRELTRRTRFTVVPGPRGRWFVRAFDIDALADLCRPAPR